MSGNDKESDRWSQSVLDDSSLIFVSDASAEAERIAKALRAMGYTVLDVPQSLLVGRVSAQPPRIILMDVAAEGALDVAAKVHALEMLSEIDILYLGDLPDVVSTTEQALLHHGAAHFSRPVDLRALAQKIENLTGGPPSGNERRSSIPPSMPSAPASRRSFGPSSQAPSGWPDPVRSSVLPQSRPPASTRAPNPSPLLPPIPFATDESDDPPPPVVGRPSTMSNLSPELALILSEAEARVGGNLSGDETFTTPEDEIEAVLPAELLASLDEPIDEDEDEEVAEIFAHSRGTTSAGGKQETTGSERFQTEPPDRAGTGSDVRAPTDRFVSSPSPRASTASKIPAEVAARAVAEAQGSSITDESAGFSQFPPPGGSVQPASTSASRTVGGDDVRHLIATAIATRETGALCFTDQHGVRRLVVRDGDLVTAASGVLGEHLLDYLVARGDMPKHHADRLIPKTPPYGRLAGAALVAQGYLSQDQMWPILRGHAEWIVGSMIGFDVGSYSFESAPPGRLATEPGVFGASPGVEVFVELMQRHVAPDEALDRMGGPNGVLAHGANAQLLAEASLAPNLHERLEACVGESLAPLFADHLDDLAAVVYALFLLGVYDIVPSIEGHRASSVEEPSPDSAALDDEAVRGRIGARLALVEEGDYFTLLGVSPNATGYEIRRAFLDLRHSFEPSHLLTPGTLDLAPHLKKIIFVLEEAYDVLKDATRRERYKKAIGSSNAR